MNEKIEKLEWQIKHAKEDLAQKIRLKEIAERDIERAQSTLKSLMSEYFGN